METEKQAIDGYPDTHPRFKILNPLLKSFLDVARSSILATPIIAIKKLYTCELSLPGNKYREKKSSWVDLGQ